MRSKALSIAATALALALAGCAPKPESTVEDFYYAVAEGDAATAQSLLSSRMRSLVPEAKLNAAFAMGAEQARECGGIRDVKVQLGEGDQIRTGTATVTYRGTCPPKTENVKLVKESGEWKIDANK